jgi:hypothetical protein
MNTRAGFLALLAMLAMPAMAAENATGKWVAAVDAGQGAVELTFVLKAEGEKLTGTLSVAGGEPTPFTEGKIKGEDVSFKLNFAIGPDAPPITISYTGKLKGDQLAIQSSFAMEGAPPTVTDFVAKRTP